MPTPREIATAIADVLPGHRCRGRVAAEDFGAMLVYVKDVNGEQLGHLTVRSDGTITENLNERGEELLAIARAAADRLK